MYIYDYIVYSVKIDNVYDTYVIINNVKTKLYILCETN